MLSQNDYLSSKRKLKKNPLCRLQKKKKGIQVNFITDRFITKLKQYFQSVCAKQLALICETIQAAPRTGVLMK